MHWNHRVIRTNGHLGIYEVFYTGEDDHVTDWTAEPVAVVGEDIEELRQTVEWMADALDKPILDEEELEAEKARRRVPH